MTKRIWELDALRGICILGMVALHLLFDLNVALPLPLLLLQEWGGYAFLLISGICVTLGHHPIRRGLVVLGCGMLCTLVTWGMYALELTSNQMVIWFGVLHCLGVCMLLWPVFQNIPSLFLWVLAAIFAGFGIYFETLFVPFPWLVPLGIRFAEFASADYFPLLPNFGVFLMGAIVGRKLYCKKQSLFPDVEPLPILRFCGRHSLAIYLLHQPILYGILWMISQF